MAERKIRSLLSSGAKVVCLSGQFTPGIKTLARQRRLLLRKTKISGRAFLKGYLKKAFLVIAATSSPAINAGIFAACRKRNILVNAVDDAKHCNFIAPSVLSRGLFSIAVSTGGASPLLAQRVRKRLGRMFGPEYAAFLRFMAGKRKSVLGKVKKPGKRKQIFRDLTDANFLDLFRHGRGKRIAQKYHEILTRHGVKTNKS